MSEHTKNVRPVAAEGHRQRMKEQFAAGGLDSFDDAKALELLLTFAIPRKDTRELAHTLLDCLGSFEKVFQTPLETLRSVEGMPPNAALLVNLVTEIGRRQLICRASHTRALRTIDECGEYLLPYFYGSRDEKVYLLCLDAKGKVLNCQCMGVGSVNSANISVRKIVAAALVVNASTVVLGHNHPSGLAIPSQDDIFATQLVRNGLEAVGIKLADHMIIADDDFVSLRQSGYMDR